MAWWHFFGNCVFFVTVSSFSPYDELCWGKVTLYFLRLGYLLFVSKVHFICRVDFRLT